MPTLVDYASEFGLTVQPNPASEIVTFSFAAGESGSYTAVLLDMSGAVVWQSGGTLESRNVLQLDAKDLRLSSGTYLLKVNIADKEASMAVVIAR